MFVGARQQQDHFNVGDRLGGVLAHQSNLIVQHLKSGLIVSGPVEQLVHVRLEHLVVQIGFQLVGLLDKLIDGVMMMM